MTEATGSRYVSQATLTLPLGPSWNSKRRSFLRQKVRAAAEAVARGKRLDPGYMYSLRLIFYDKWYKADGTPYRKDLSNLIKVIEDEIFRAFQLDDKHVGELVATKGDVVAWRPYTKGTVGVIVNSYRKL